MFSDEQINNISKNLNFFKKVYNEKQIDVCESIGISASTYSGYIKMTSIPNRENLNKLANHYNITEYQLINCDMRFETKENRTIYKYMSKLLAKMNVMFPVVCEINIKDDLLYKEAARMFQKIFTNIKEKGNYIKMLELFFESFEKNNNYDSCANILLLILLEKSNIKYPVDGEYMNVYNIFNEKELEIFIKDCYLKNYDEEEIIKNEKDNYELYNNLTDKYKEVLVDKIEYHEFLNYYNVLEYILGIGNLEYSKEMNNLIALEMLKNLAFFNNKYAISFLECIDETFNFE